eukprot:5215961-Ditylum_brightwellii.AAC.1
MKPSYSCPSTKGDVLKGTIMCRESEAESEVGTGNKYTMTNKEKMDALLFSHYKRRALQVSDDQKLRIAAAW